MCFVGSRVDRYACLVGRGVDLSENKRIKNEETANMENKIIVGTERVAGYKNDLGGYGDLGGSSVLVGRAGSDIVDCVLVGDTGSVLVGRAGSSFIDCDCDLDGSSLVDRDRVLGGGSVLVDSADCVLFDLGLVDRDTCLVGISKLFLGRVRSKRGSDPVEVIQVKTEDQYDRVFASQLRFSTT